MPTIMGPTCQMIEHLLVVSVSVELWLGANEKRAHGLVGPASPVISMNASDITGNKKPNLAKHSSRTTKEAWSIIPLKFTLQHQSRDPKRITIEAWGCFVYRSQEDQTYQIEESISSSDCPFAPTEKRRDRGPKDLSTFCRYSCAQENDLIRNA